MKTLNGTLNKIGRHAHPGTCKREMLGGMLGRLAVSQDMMADRDHHISHPEKTDQGKSEGDVPYEGS